MVEQQAEATAVNIQELVEQMVDGAQDLLAAAHVMARLAGIEIPATPLEQRLDGIEGRLQGIESWCRQLANNRSTSPLSPHPKPDPLRPHFGRPDMDGRFRRCVGPTVGHGQQWVAGLQDLISQHWVAGLQGLISHRASQHESSGGDNPLTGLFR